MGHRWNGSGIPSPPASCLPLDKKPPMEVLAKRLPPHRALNLSGARPVVLSHRIAA